MANSRNSQNYKNSFCWQHFRKRCKDLTPEERREFFRLAKAKSRDGQTEEQREKQRQYCKKYREVHREEIRERRRKVSLSGKKCKPDAWHNTFCWQYFGKRRKDLNKEEVAIYRHLMYIGYGKSDEENAKRKQRAREMRYARIGRVRASRKKYYENNKKEIIAKALARKRKKKQEKEANNEN